MGNAAAHGVLLIGGLIAFGLFGAFRWGSYAIDNGTGMQRAGALAVVAGLAVVAVIVVINVFA
jgi:hypothetical protein